jgi:hypothetical protein
MERHFLHDVRYEVPSETPLADIAYSILATEAVVRDIVPLLEECMPGVKVETIDLRLREISQHSPLRELFLVTLIVTFQEQLAKEVPVAVEKLFGRSLPDEFDATVTVLTLVIAFYSLDFLYRKVIDPSGSRKIKAQLDGLVRDLADQLRVGEEVIRSALKKRYTPNHLQRLAGLALKWLNPAKRGGAYRVVVGGRVIDAEVIAEIPSRTDLQLAAPDEISQEIPGVEIELHAQDMDAQKRGWAGVIKGVSEKRLKMELYPTIRPEDIYLRDRIKGDVLLQSRKKDGGQYAPYMFHLMRLDTE